MSEAGNLQQFLHHFRIDGGLPPRRLLGRVCSAFAHIPYENLSKIIKEAESGRPEKARRSPAEVLGDHVARGTGGTCFSLTAAFLSLLRGLGWQAEPILADRHYGLDTHCALLVWIDGTPHLVDPGYLITSPSILPNVEETKIETPFNTVVLRPREGGRRLELHTEQKGGRTHRLTFKTDPVDAGEFLAAWDASFDWDMMHYPVLTRVHGDKQLYLQNRRLQIRGRENVERIELSPDELVAKICSEFGIDRAVVVRALEVLDRQGDLHG